MEPILGMTISPIWLVVSFFVGLALYLLVMFAYRYGRRAERSQTLQEREKRLHVAREKMKTSTSSLSK